MPGENISNRPPGANNNDLNDLNDWTITDIATTPNAASEDRENAKAEIARRKNEDTYNPESSERQTHDDLLSHGYGVEDGKLLYPKPEYKAWLQSDRTGQRPAGIVRESIQDRLADEDKTDDKDMSESNEETADSNEVKTLYIHDYDDESPTIEKIRHPKKIVTEKDQIQTERRQKEKVNDIERDNERKSKNYNKYSSSISNKESALKFNEEAKTLEGEVEKLYNIYDTQFKRYATKWLTYGVSSAIKNGTCNTLPINSMITSGFWSREQNIIQKHLDPQETFSEDTIDAEYKLKTHVAQEIIDQKSHNLSDIDIKQAKYRGSLYAIYTGAEIDNRTKQVIYAIPPEKGDEISDFMRKSGVNFQDSGDKARARSLSYQGFANIIDAIKDNSKETKNGFKALDWYFDNFQYDRHLDAFLGELSAYEETADDAWRKKYYEYQTTKDGIVQYYEDRKNAKLPVYDIEHVQEDVSEQHIKSLIANITDSEQNLIFQTPAINRGGYNHGSKISIDTFANRSDLSPYHYVDSKKLSTILAKRSEYSYRDPSIRTHMAAGKDEKVHYVILEYSQNEHLVSVIAPYEFRSSDAAFCILDQDWRELLIEQEDKLTIRNHDNVKAFNHRANPTANRDSIQNMWYNLEQHINQSTAEK